MDPLFRDFGHSLNPRTAQILSPLCTALPATASGELRAQLPGYLQSVRLAQRDNEFLDLASAERIAAVLEQLLDRYASFPTDHQALICGATRYFLHAQDADPDLHSILGFEDDLEVVNCVVSAIGRPELRIDP